MDDADDIAAAYARREAILEILYKDAPYMRPPAPPAVARPPALPAAPRPAEPPEVTLSRALLGDKRTKGITALAAGLAAPIKDHVVAAVADGVRPLCDRIGELEGRLGELEREIADLRERVPHIRRVV